MRRHGLVPCEEHGLRCTYPGMKGVISLRISRTLAVVLMLLIATSALGIEHKAYQFRDDFEMESGYDCALQYYYFIPCPTYAWFWAFYGWERDDIVGMWFDVGDLSMQGMSGCDPTSCHVLEGIRYLDMAAYTWYYPYLFGVEIDVYCCDGDGWPIGPSLWTSERYYSGMGWNYVWVDPPLTICECVIDPGPPPSTPRILITATHVGWETFYPAWGCDDISTPLELGCLLHDSGCLPALYPRPYVGHYPTIHSGYYGNGALEYCPPLRFKDGRDTTPDGSQFGFVELAWRVYVTCSGPTDAQPATWSSIKSLYR